MSRKEWREVGKQSLYFVLLLAGIALLIGVIDLIQGWSFESEKFIIMLGLWLLTASMFLGLSPFAMDSRQKGMEYLLSLPISRRRLLLIKLLPRLAAVVLFYGIFFLLYGHMGNDAFGGYFAFFSLSYFALFFISFSFSSIHENFIVQSIWAGFALCGYLTLCSLIVTLGFAWNSNFSLGSLWRFGHFGNLVYDSSGWITAIAVFLLLLAPFIVSYFLAFKKFDLKSSRVFNRCHLLLFIPLLFLALAASLGVSYMGQRSSIFDRWSHYYLTADHRLLKIGWLGKLSIHDESTWSKIKTKRDFQWNPVVFERKGALFLIGDDMKDDSTVVTRFDLIDFSKKILYKIPDHYLVSFSYYAFKQSGQDLVFLQRGRAEAEKPGMQASIPLKSDCLDLVVLDLDSGKSRTLSFQNPLFKNYYQPNLFAGDEINGRRFWLIGGQGQGVIRIWEGGVVEDLGRSKKMPAYFGHLLFSTSDKSLVIRRLLASGGETVKEIAGEFHALGGFHHALATGEFTEIYAKSGKQIVRIDLKTFAVTMIGPENGYLLCAAPGDFYYVKSSRSLPFVSSKPAEKWRKVFRLKDGKMILLKQFDFVGKGLEGLGYIDVEEHGIVVRDSGVPRFFAFPDLRELKFKKLN
jgi:hypothetical protein